MTAKAELDVPVSAHLPPPCIAALGASTGGMEALYHFFHAMPANTGLAFVVVQHLHPQHLSLTAELLAKHTAMPVTTASEGERVMPNHVYTTPSDQLLTLHRGRLRLSPRSDKERLWLPIDRFFESLADDAGARAIGVVLSGAGSDGALGVRAIAAAGGMVLVQEPASAGSDGMPHSAIATGSANHVLPVSRMPAVIATYARHPYVSGNRTRNSVEGDDRAIVQLIKLVQARRGYDFSVYKRNTLLRRVERRMGLHGIQRRDAYVMLLRRDELELDALFRDLLIGVTEFFRDAEAWVMLDTEVIKPLVAEREEGEPIRIWVPGCSTGEEAYTLAMLVLSRLRRARKHCPVQVFATDTNHAALDVGRLGRYPLGITAHVPATYLRRYFTRSEDRQHFVVSDELRAAVVFGLQNLFADPPFGRVDLISCRNVLIYLEPAVQKRVLSMFHFALRQDAHLFLGSAESNGGRDDLFRPISKKWRLYRREGRARVEALSLSPQLAEVSRPSTTTLPERMVSPGGQAALAAQKLILDRFAPAAILINSQCEALYFCGPTDDYLMRLRGTPTLDLLAMVREGLRSRLQAAVREAVTQDLQVVATGAHMKHGDDFAPVQITVAPVRDSLLGRVFLVVFQPDLKPALIPIDKSGEGVLVRHLEEELQVTRDELQGTVKRFEAAHENLRLSNEVVITTNEELRSLNEELETSKEELQSLNEELTTVNQQLETKLRELENAHNDLNNLLNNSDIATICLDQTLRIKWFAPAAQKQFNLIAGDIGRPVSDIASAVGDSTLLQAARVVLAQQPVPDQELQLESGRWYMRRTLPYEAEGKQISGVIVNYTDITEFHQAHETVTATRRDLSASLQVTAKLRALSMALALAEERERRTLARDLHDDLGQLLAVIGIKAAVVQRQPMPVALKSAVNDCAAAVDLANQKLRAMALQLNPPMLDQLGLVSALQWLVDELARSHELDVLIRDDGQPKPLDAAVSATLFRVVRDLLTDVARHAKVRRSTITLARTPAGQLRVTVSDVGEGLNAATVMPGLDKLSLEGSAPSSLLGMRERLGFLGGELLTERAPGRGTSVMIRVPLLSEPAPAKKTRRRSKA